jgi:MinD-like ATPase involved in chromosome partitioning or flagellar assembly
MADRFVVLGLAPTRAAWFADVARWATSAALPVDFAKVVSVEEVRARLRSGRPFSALLVDGASPGLDRDLVELAAGHGCAVLVVSDGRGRSWPAGGVAQVLHTPLERMQLLDALRTHARPIRRRDEPTIVPGRPADGGGWRGRMVALTGAGGVGRSTLAMALATGLAADPRDRGLVVLADLALHAQQALLHDAGDVVPGLLELVEAHRTGGPAPDEVRSLCFTVGERGYDLLLGVRRHRDWTALRRWALSAALDGLRRTYRLVVADVDPDVEGEADCGSVDVEERNLLARSVLPAADLVVVVGVPGLGGLHSQLRVIRDLLALGVEPVRVLPVVNRAPRNPRARAEVGGALARLLAADGPPMLAGNPVFVPERRGVDEALRDGTPPPGPLVTTVSGAVRALLDRMPVRSAEEPPDAVPEAVAVVPGTLGSWSPDADDGEGAP